MQVKNIKSEVVDYSPVLNKYKNLVLKYQGVDITEFKFRDEKLSFEIWDSYVAFANSIRRILLDELKVKCLTFKNEDIETNDKYIVKELLRKCVNMIPINQEKFEVKNLKLYKTNNTPKIIDVKSDDIGITENITISRLRPGCSLKINKFYIEEGYQYKDACKFTLCENVKYKILDVIPFNEDTGEGVRSVMSEPKKFYIEFTVCKASCKYVMNEMKKTILERLDKYLSVVKENEISKDNEFIFDDYITLTNVICQKIYQLDNNILLVTCPLYNYDENKSVLKIIHNNPKEIIIKAIEEIKKEYIKFFESF